MRRCSECGRSLDGLLSERLDRNPFEMIAQSRLLQAAICLLIVLACVGLDAIVR